MNPTSARTLIVAAVVAAAVTFAVLAAVYESLPELPRSAPVTTGVAGIFEGALSVSVRARLAGRPRTKPILPLTVARLAALARASSLVGALAVGVWVGVLATTLPQGSDPPAAGADSITAGLGLAAAGALVVGALLLERACRVRR